MRATSSCRKHQINVVSCEIWLLKNPARRERTPWAGRPMCSRLADISVLVAISKLAVCSLGKSLRVGKGEPASQPQASLEIFEGRFLCT